ncbi:MGMT family protein [Spongiibacter marinus]|uniref:MGMT family protein n=1 Tax=Spongiibacter marinus TaxID=354246 RepID=UPI003567F2C0
MTNKPSDQARRQLLLALSQIPSGRLCSYGELARQAGLPGRARWVGRQLSQLPDHNTLPWHRVINAQGKISFPDNSEAYRRQLSRLIDEGSASPDGKIAWQRCRWPDQH